MGRPLQILLLEDNKIDAELIVYQLEESGIEAHCQRVDTRETFLAALSPDIDLVLVDLNLPQFSGPEALELVREKGLALPCILISGIRNDELAMQSMEWDAAGYVPKDALERLGSAIRQALEGGRTAP